MDAPVPEGVDWAKLAPRQGEPERWHPRVGSRLAALAGIETLPQVWAERLVALAFLHDFGKANRKFQRREGGHIREAAFIAGRPEKDVEAIQQEQGPAWRSPPSRLMEFCTEKELQNQTGHHVEEWPKVVTKEVMDNALDDLATMPP
jgi:hypothetical protein